MGEKRSISNLIDVTLRNEHTERFERFVRMHHRSRRLVLFTRTNVRGLVRHYVQVPAGKMPAFIASFGPRQRVVGLFCLRHRDSDHLYLRLGTKVYHLEYETPRGGEPYWTLNGGGHQARFRESSSILTERLVQLTADEFARLRKRACALRAEARRRRGPIDLDVNRDNCVNVWMSAPVGSAGASLAKVIGIQEEDYGPAVMNQILDSGNDRVLGAAIYPPRGQEFRRFQLIRERM